MLLFICLTSTSGSEWNLMLAGMTLSMVPIIIIYIAAQKYITSGLTAGAVKIVIEKENGRKWTILIYRELKAIQFSW